MAHTTQATLIQDINDAMIDLRNATGETTYCLECWDGDEDPDAQQMQVFVGGERHGRAVSPRLSMPAMLAYLTAFNDGVHAGYLAAKRGR